jgi:hypothetical protein
MAEPEHLPPVAPVVEDPGSGPSAGPASAPTPTPRGILGDPRFMLAGATLLVSCGVIVGLRLGRAIAGRAAASGTVGAAPKVVVMECAHCGNQTRANTIPPPVSPDHPAAQGPSSAVSVGYPPIEPDPSVPGSGPPPRPPTYEEAQAIAAAGGVPLDGVPRRFSHAEASPRSEP